MRWLCCGHSQKILIRYIVPVSEREGIHAARVDGGRFTFLNANLALLSGLVLVRRGRHVARRVTRNRLPQSIISE